MHDNKYCVFDLRVYFLLRWAGSVRAICGVSSTFLHTIIHLPTCCGMGEGRASSQKIQMMNQVCQRCVVLDVQSRLLFRAILELSLLDIDIIYFYFMRNPYRYARTRLYFLAHYIPSLYASQYSRNFDRTKPLIVLITILSLSLAFLHRSSQLILDAVLMYRIYGGKQSSCITEGYLSYFHRYLQRYIALVR